MASNDPDADINGNDSPDTTDNISLLGSDEDLRATLEDYESMLPRVYRSRLIKQENGGPPVMVECEVKKNNESDSDNPFDTDEEVDICDEEFKLCNAVLYNETDLLKEMLESGKNPNCFDKLGRCPMHVATYFGFDKTIEILLKYGADPNMRNPAGVAPLHAVGASSDINYADVLTVLLKAGANVDLLNQCGKTPIQILEDKVNLIKSSCTDLTPETITKLKDLYFLILNMSWHSKGNEQEKYADDLAELERQLQNLKTKDQAESYNSI